MPYPAPSTLVNRKLITPADPSVGSEVEIIVPDGKSWEVRSVTFTLTTEETVATRAVVLGIDDGATEFWHWQAGITQATGTAYDYFFLDSLNDEIDRIKSYDEYYAPLPRGVVLGQGWRITTTTANLQGLGSGSGSGDATGDQFSDLVLNVVEYG